MASTLRHIRTPLIALAAIFAASLAAGEASACSTMKQGQGTCVTVCGCCSPQTDGAPTTGAGIAPRATTPSVPASCREAPGGDCSFHTQEPAAPPRKPAQSAAQDRPELGQGPHFVPLGEAYAA